MSLRKCIYTVLCGLYCPVVIASDYSTPLVKPEWRTAGSLFECKLEHRIPNYGWMEVQQRAGEPQQLFLKTDLILAYQGDAKVYSATAPWHAHTGISARTLLGTVTPKTEKTAVILEQPLSKQVLQTLKAGRMTTFELGKDSVTVSTVGFQGAYDEFASCLAALLPVSFKDLQGSHVFFDKRSYEITREGQSWLDYVIAYFKAEADPVAMVQLEGFTDNQGTYAENRLLSLKRVWAVKDYLVYHGVPAQKIRLRGMASRNPIADNATEAGRAYNHRVTLELVRDPYVSPQYRD